MKTRRPDSRPSESPGGPSRPAGALRPGGRGSAAGRAPGLVCSTAARRAALGWAALGWAALAVLAAGSAEAYRFFDSRGEDAPLRSWRLVGADEALRWSAAAWGPGTALDWEVAPDPDFEGLFGGASGVLPHLERALASWSDLPSTDITWTASLPDEANDEFPEADGRNTFFLDAESGAGGYAALWSRRNEEEVWELVECDFTLGSWAARTPESDRDEARRIAAATATIVHELGHCIGLAHAGSLSMLGRRGQRLLSLRNQPVELIHPRDPAMSYGYAQRNPAGVPPDDAVGASLLRPAAGWWQRTGTIYGRLHTGGDPAPWVQVWAVPTGSDRPLEDRIGGFSDERGRFRLEGLPAGDYLLWAHPLVIQAAHFVLGANGAPFDLDDTVLGRPVRVRPGQYTTGVEIPMRIGRTSRPPPDIPPPSEPAPLAPADSWSVPCPGIRVRAERPYPADGPHGASEPDFERGGDVWLTTEVVVEWAADAEGVVFDWAGLYRDWRMPYWRRRSIRDAPPRAGAPYLDLALPEWGVTGTGETVRHTLVVDWPESAEAGLRFRSADGECSDRPTFVCRADGCGLR